MTNQAFGVHHQQGMVLVIGLIFLLLMTVIGVTSIQTTTLDERMAGNLRDKNIAFQAAEAALREGEGWLEENGYKEDFDEEKYDLSRDLAEQWDGVDPEPIGSHDQFSDQLYADPVYHIGKPNKSQKYKGDIDSGICNLHPVVSRSVGRLETTTVVLRTYYGICDS
ncbi:pilus assembly PilX family protein [Rhabdochromatium marinum]|uniref:pilus assembly PilX family protein n=1 Tax=Rhabdochromatium marinum TaxID=48729 RepID=UPI001907D164|nr:PilX N-terminal domain-containing pilus assembly protein [Rhabdochromatium marinum]MBK1647901.1 hypothetical protein [Rhabdochromatium marinum]